MKSLKWFAVLSIFSGFSFAVTVDHGATGGADLRQEAAFGYCSQANLLTMLSACEEGRLDGDMLKTLCLSGAPVASAAASQPLQSHTAGTQATSPGAGLTGAAGKALLAKGKAIYESRCNRCHNGNTFPSFKIGLDKGARRVEKAEMPPDTDTRGTLSEAEKTAVAAYIRSMNSGR